MAAVIGIKTQGEHQVSGAKSGDFYDDCINPDCGRRDVDRQWKIGGTNPRNGETHLHAAIYGCSPKDGGCGETWTRTTRQGVAADYGRGMQSKWLTQGAAAARTVSIPSAVFKDRYALIDWSK
jgi:hypothetical protein